MGTSSSDGFSSENASSAGGASSGDARFAASPGLAASYTPPSGNSLIDGVLWGYKWPTTALTYAFPSAAGAFQYSLQGFGQFTPTAQAATIASLKMYSDVSLLTFTAGADPSTANIRSGYATGIDYTGGVNFQPPAGTAGTAEANPPDPEFNQRQWGDNWYNPNDFNSPKLGDYAFLTIVHELGHSLGLKHGHSTQTVTDQPGVVLPTLPADRDSLEFSVMTYRSFIGAPTAGGFSNEPFGYPQTLMMADIAALQYMYGANYGASANNTDTVYAFNPTTGAMTINGVAQQAPGDGAGGAQNRIFRTIWDGGGVDAYDLSNYATNQQIDLRPGFWSKFSDAQLANLGADAQNVPQMARGNVFNALMFNGNVASLIENAIGGSGNDVITGNAANNVLQGGSGSDTLIGGAGSDVLDGGDGFDTVDFGSEGGFQGISLNLLLSNGFDSFGAFETIGNIEGVVATNFNDVIYALNSGDVISALGGADQIVSWGGDDLIDGGAGNDVILAWTGNDTARGGDDDDYLWMGDGADRAEGGSGADVLVGDLPGSAEIGADTLVGGLGTDILLGGAGGDLIYGGLEEVSASSDAGNRDWLIGGAGDDTMYGGGGDDVIWEQLDAAHGGDDQAFGGDGADLILTAGGADTINGGSGNDTIYGGGGADAITLGAGADLAWIVEAADFGDVYTDFVTAEDRLAIYGVLGGTKTTAQAFADANFLLQQAGADTQLLYAATAGGPSVLAATFQNKTVASFNLALDFI
jgi:serralysin